jgi:hypothetical protein
MGITTLLKQTTFITIVGVNICTHVYKVVKYGKLAFIYQLLALARKLNCSQIYANKIYLLGCKILN